MKKLIDKYQDLVIYRMGLMCLLWAPIPVAVIKLQGELLSPNMITLIMAVPCLFGLTQRWVNSKLNSMTAAYCSFAGNVLYIVVIGLSPALGVEPAWMLVLSPVVGSFTGLFDNIGESKACNDFKAYIELDDFHSRDTKVQSACMLGGQGITFIFYNLFPNVDMFQLWFIMILVCNAIYVVIDIQRIQLLKAMYHELNITAIPA